MIVIYLILFMLPGSVYAYLDPGTGAALVNLLVAGIATLIYALKGFIYRLLTGKSTKSIAKPNSHTLAILSEGKQYWTTFEPIVKNLISQEIPFDYYTLDVEDQALLIDNEFMNSRFLGYGYLAYHKASTIKAEYLLCTTPNIGCKGYPIARSSRVKKYVHVFHSINDLSMYRKGSLDYYDMVFQVGDFQAKSIREIEKKRNLKEKELVTLGLPYLDIYSQGAILNTDAKGKKTILIGSSWGSKGLLNHYGTGFIRTLAEKGFEIILRPHPQSLVTEQQVLARCKAELQMFDNVTWDTAISPQNSMNQADLLISDTSSLRFDYAFIYGKPVITLEIPQDSMPGYERDDMDEIWSDTAEKMIGYFVPEKDIDRLAEFVEKALDQHSPEKIRQFRDETIANYGCCGKAIADYFAVIIKRES